MNSIKTISTSKKDINQLDSKSNDIVESTKDEVKEIGENKEKLGEGQVKSRLYLLRHYPYIEDENFKKYSELLNLKKDGKLDEEGNIKLNELLEKLKIRQDLNDLSPEEKQLYENILGDENTLVYYDDTEFEEGSVDNRVVDTTNDLLSYFNENILNVGNSNLKPTSKKISLGENAKNSINNFEPFYNNIIKKDIQSGKYKNIIIISNRSYAFIFNQVVGSNIDITIRDSAGNLETNSYMYYDFNTKGKVLKYSNNILKITPYNYNSILLELNGYGIEIDHNGINDYQNKINQFFQNDKALFKKYLNSENKDLRFFCISNLFEGREIENIKFISDYYKNTENISEKEENILIKNIDLKEIKECYIKLLERGKVNKLQNDVNIKALSKVREVQYRSLDEEIKNQEGGVIDRDLFFVRKEINIETYEFSYFIEETNIQDIINNKSVNKFVLPAHVGSGKTIWISELTKTIINDYPEFEVYYFEGKDFNNQIDNIITDKLKEITSNNNEKIIIFFDGVDEIVNNTVKQEIKKIIEESDNKIIVTGRLSEYNDKENDGFGTLGFNLLSKEEFLEEKIIDQERKNKLLKFLKISNLSGELESNPLLLNFVCILDGLDEEQKENYENNFGIKSLENIKNKTDLYESIVRLILGKHYEKKGEKLPKKFLKKYLDELSEYAYQIFNDPKNLKVDIDDEESHILSIFFKKSGTLEYQFIHESFQDFFLARYLSGNNKNDGKEDIILNKKIYKQRDSNTENWNDWRDFKQTVIFYGESLFNSGSEEDLEKLDYLLGSDGILKNDDVFGEGFFIGLELLYNLEKKDGKNEIVKKYKKLYLYNIKTWDNKKLLNSLKLFQDFQKNINYGNNKYVDSFYTKILFNYIPFNKYSEVYIEIYKLGNKKCINGYFKNFKSSINIGEHKIYLQIYKELIKIHNEKGIKDSIKLAKDLIDEGNYEIGVQLYIELIRIHNEIGIEEGKKLAKDLLYKEEYDRGLQIYGELFKIGDKTWIEEIKEIIVFIKEKKDNLSLDKKILIMENIFEKVEKIKYLPEKKGKHGFLLEYVDKGKGGLNEGIKTSKSFLEIGEVEFLNEVMKEALSRGNIDFSKGAMLGIIMHYINIGGIDAEILAIETVKELLDTLYDKNHIINGTFFIVSLEIYEKLINIGYYDLIEEIVDGIKFYLKNGNNITNIIKIQKFCNNLNIKISI